MHLLLYPFAICCWYFVGNSLNATAAEALNQVALPVVDHDTCKRMDYWWFQVKTSMICCGYTLPDELKSVCQVKFCAKENMMKTFVDTNSSVYVLYMSFCM